MNIDCTSLINVRAYCKIANTPLKCVPRPQLPHYIPISRPIHLSKRSIKLHCPSNHLQTFISCKTHGRETGSTNPLITPGNPNPSHWCGFCHVMSMQCKVLIDKHVVWILPCKIRVNDGQAYTNFTQIDQDLYYSITKLCYNNFKYKVIRITLFYINYSCYLNFNITVKFFRILLLNTATTIYAKMIKNLYNTLTTSLKQFYLTIDCYYNKHY